MPEFIPMPEFEIFGRVEDIYADEAIRDLITLETSILENESVDPEIAIHSVIAWQQEDAAEFRARAMILADVSYDVQRSMLADGCSEQEVLEAWQEYLTDYSLIALEALDERANI